MAGQLAATAPGQAAQIDALVAAQSASRADLARAAVLAATGQVASMAEARWYEDQAVAQLAVAIAKQVAAAQRQTAALTDAYLSGMTSILLGRRIGPVGPVDVAALRGLPSALVYERLGKNYRYLRSLGIDNAEALARTSERAAVMAQTDTTLAMRKQAQRFMERRRISGYRRIIRPEASASGTCGLCIAAADRIYHRATLLPIHDRCKCEIAPIVNGQDPGHSLNSADLQALYDAAGSTKREDLKRIRITQHHHGELGPVLGVHGQAFRGPGDLPHAA